MPLDRSIPRPCIRFSDSPTGERNFVYESPSGVVVPVGSEEDARVYVLDHRIHRKYGRCFIQTADSPKKFATLITDDGGDENETSFEDDG